MLHLHPNARTTPAIRAEVARSSEPSGTVALRYGISAGNVRKWRKRGVADCLDRSAGPHHRPWKATEEERAIVCTLRRNTNFALDDLTFVVCHFLPHLNRDSIWLPLPRTLHNQTGVDLACFVHTRASPRRPNGFEGCQADPSSNMTCDGEFHR